MNAPTTNDKAREQAGQGAKQKEAELQHPNSAREQRRRLLEALRLGPVSTLWARRELDILAPASRVLELRHEGHHIITHWTWEDSGIRPHRVGTYALLNEVKHGN